MESDSTLRKIAAENLRDHGVRGEVSPEVVSDIGVTLPEDLDETIDQGRKLREFRFPHGLVETEPVRRLSDPTHADYEGEPPAEEKARNAKLLEYIRTGMRSHPASNYPKHVPQDK